jgi:hypothetical protein
MAALSEPRFFVNAMDAFEVIFYCLSTRVPMERPIALPSVPIQHIATIKFQNAFVE